MVDHFFFIAKKTNNFQLNLHSLYDLYLPILDQIAIHFYIHLYNLVDCYQKNNNLTFNSINTTKQLICTNEQLLLAKKKLEGIGLISTYISINSNNDKIMIFVIKSALNFEEFILNQKFKALLIKQIGQTNYEYLEYKNSTDQKLVNSIEITENFDNVFNNQDLQHLPTISLDNLYKNIQKSTSHFLIIDQDCKDLIYGIHKKHSFPLKTLETIIYESINEIEGNFVCNKNLLVQNFNAFINKKDFSTIFISINRNVEIFSNSISLNEEKKIINDYQMYNSELYLASIFKRSLNDEEKKILSILKNKYQLKDKIINILVDFSLNKTNGKLNEKYLIKTANSINGLGLIDCKQVINHFKKALNNKNDKSYKQLTNQYFSKGF